MPPLHAVCTTGMVADILRNIGEPHLEVTALMGPGVDPHLYKATPGDIRALSAADVVFYSGLHLEGKLTEIFERLARRKPTFAVTATLDEKGLIPLGEGLHDPHVWFDVSMWSTAAGYVGETLARIDPTHAADYHLRTETYRARLAELHAECRRRIAEIPPQQRVMVTAHDAFHYFGRAYDIEVRAIQGVSTVSEAGVKTINELVDFLVARKIRAVFIETSVSDRNVRALIEGCAARGHAVRIGGELFSDAMGRVGTPEGTYVGMVRHNVTVIVEALTGQAARSVSDLGRR